MSKRLIQRRWCNLLLPRKYVRFQNLVVVLIGVISMLSLVLLYEATRPHSNLRTMLTARARRHKLFKKNFGNNSAACRLPNLDPFHSSVATVYQRSWQAKLRWRELFKLWEQRPCGRRRRYRFRSVQKDRENTWRWLCCCLVGSVRGSKWQLESNGKGWQSER